MLTSANNNINHTRNAHNILYQLGKNKNIKVTKSLMDNKNFSQFVNEDSMSVLNNYAKHENLKIEIFPSKRTNKEDEVINLLKVFVSKGGIFLNQKIFILELEKKQDMFKNFMQNFYKKIELANKQLNKQ